MFQYWQLQLPHGHHLWVSLCSPCSESLRNLPACSGVNNWNLFPSVAGMNMSPVSRLKKTWGKAKTAKFFILEVQQSPMNHWLRSTRLMIIWGWLCVAVCHLLWQHQMDPTGNFYNYRTALRGAAHRSQTANSNRERVGLSPDLLLLIKHSGMDLFIYFHLHVHIFSLFHPVRLWFLSSVCWSKTFTSWMRDAPTGCPTAMSTLRSASLLPRPGLAILKVHFTVW